MASVPTEISLPPLDAKSVNVLESAVAGYDRERLLWSSGYLAGMSAAGQQKTALQPVVAATPSSWKIFYATETGNSRRIAETLTERSRQAGLTVTLHNVRDYKPRSLVRVRNALFVIATHGIGEAPEGTEPFFEYWLSERAPRLDELNYAILAVGDSSYADFCEMGNMFDRRLRELGATAFVEKVECDIDYEALAEGWTDEVVTQASKQVETDVSTGITYLRPVSTETSLIRARPFRATVLSEQRITGKESSKDVRHIELDLENSGLAYLPGDSLGVIPQNPPQLVNSLLDALQLDAGESVTFDGETIPLSHVLTRHKEITILSRPLLAAVASEQEDLQSVLQDRDKLTDLLKSRQVIDIVSDYRLTWQPQAFVDALRRLTPRLYSIASSPDANPGEAHLTVAVVQYERFGRNHWGSASNHLISGADEVPIFIEKNNHFRLPTDGDAPIIMIAAGAGIAPYRAFIEHRREHGHTGDNWLMYGDRNISSDFLYQIEWLRYRKDGSLRQLDVAFSRDQQQKIYVQHRMLEQAKLVYSWLERGAHIYVCGNADQMARGVNQALLAVLQTEGAMNNEQAGQYLAELKAAHRYQRDVY